MRKTYQFIKYKEPKVKPKNGDSRITKKFAWLPVTIQHEHPRYLKSWIWLQHYTVKSIFVEIEGITGGGFWSTEKLINV